MDEDKLIELFRALARGRVRFAVFGAVAMAIHGLPRATEDVDLFLPLDRGNLDALKVALRETFEDQQVDEIGVDDLLGDYPVVRYSPTGIELTIDIVTRIGEAFRFEDLDIEELLVEGVTVPVVTARMLYRMKRRTVRDKDRIDAASLKRTFGFEDET